MSRPTIAWALTGSFCTLDDAIDALEKVAGRYEIIPVLSENAALYDTRFGCAKDFIARLEALTGRHPICSIAEAEPLGPVIKPALIVVAPATGNTVAKLAHSITDTAATMAVKSMLRGDKPVLLAPATNDALAGSLRNIAELLPRKNYYFVPMRQDSPQSKPHSLVADFTRLGEAVDAALAGVQLRPLFI